MRQAAEQYFIILLNWLSSVCCRKEDAHEKTNVIVRMCILFFCFFPLLCYTSQATPEKSSIGFSPQIEDEFEPEFWDVKFDDNGKKYLENPETGEQIVVAYRFDEYDNPIEVDLSFYAQEVNYSSLAHQLTAPLPAPDGIIP